MERKSIYAPGWAVICKRLKAMRADARLTLRQLARKLRRAHSIVGKIEKGERRVDLLEFVAICRACGVKPELAFTKIMADLRLAARHRG